MTVLEESLATYLATYTGLVSLVSDRIYHFDIKQGSDFPCVTYQRISTLRILTHDSAGIGGDLVTPRFQFSCWATTYLAAKAVADQIRAGLNGRQGLTGTQVETGTVIGTITGAGNETVVVTCTGMTGTPITTNVAVSLGDTASAVAGKIRTALGSVANITSFLTVGGSGATVTLTRLNSLQIADLNIATSNGTCAGLTSAPTSTNTSYTVMTLQAVLADNEVPIPDPEPDLIQVALDFLVWAVE
jgi:hypothetical protein